MQKRYLVIPVSAWPPFQDFTNISADFIGRTKEECEKWLEEYFKTHSGYKFRIEEIYMKEGDPQG